MATTLRELGFKLGYDLDKQSEKNVEDSIQSLKSMATKMLGAIGIGFSLTQIVALTEEFNGINDKINYAVKGLGDQKEAQNAVLKAANESKTSYGDMADIVSKLVQSNSTMFPVDEAVAFSSNVTKLLKTAGQGESEIKAIMEALNKSFQKGQVDTETLNQLLEKSPEGANILAKSLGVDRTQLLQLATDGKMTTQQLKDAFIGATDEINAGFSGLNFSISDAMLNVRNSWGFFLEDMNSTLGITETIAKGIVKLSDIGIQAAQKIKTRIEWVADKLGGTDKLLKLIAVTAGAVFLALNGQKILSFLKSAGSMLNTGKLKTLAIVAAIVLLALLVEDFFKFMKGEDSLIGTMLEKAGVDTDAFRETVRGLWDQIKEVIGTVKEFGRAIGGVLLDALRQVLPMLGKLIAAILPVLVQLAGKVISTIGQLAQTVLPMIVNLLSTLIPFLVQIIEAILPVIISLIETLLPIIMQIIDAVLPVIIDLLNTLMPVITQIIEAVLPVILELIQAIVPIFVQIIETILPVILELIEALLPILQPIIELVASLVDALLPPIVSLLEAILPILEPILAILGPIADILGVIIGAISKVVGWVSSGLKWIVDLIFGGGGDTSAADKVNAYAEGTDSSSDTFIAGEEGPELVTGAAGRKVFTALETGNIFRAMALLGQAAVARPATVSTSSSTRTINQYNQFSSTFNGDRAGQQKSAEAMESASDNAVDAMARALAFGR